MWNGMGVNYKAIQANWAADMAYFKSIGLTGIRPNLLDLPYPWAVGSSAQGGYAFWRNMAQTFSQNGFWVSWGPSGLNGTDTAGSLTAAIWPNYHDSVVAEAAYLQSQGISLGSFELGNERESHVDGTTMTIAQFIANIKQLATDVKAVYSLAPISYATYYYTDWLNAGPNLGGLDYLNLHPYSNIAYASNGTSVKGLAMGGFAQMPQCIKQFGANHLYVSEFGLDADFPFLTGMSNQFKVACMRDRYAFLKNLGFQHILAYTYVGYLNQDNQFAFKLTDGSFDPQWDVFLQDGKRTSNVELNTFQ